MLVFYSTEVFKTPGALLRRVGAFSNSQISLKRRIKRKLTLEYLRNLLGV